MSDDGGEGEHILDYEDYEQPDDDCVSMGEGYGDEYEDGEGYEEEAEDANGFEGEGGEALAAEEAEPVQEHVDEDHGGEELKNLADASDDEDAQAAPQRQGGPAAAGKGKIIKLGGTHKYDRILDTNKGGKQQSQRQQQQQVAPSGKPTIPSPPGGPRTGHPAAARLPAGPIEPNAHFFIIRSANQDNFDISKRCGLWGTQPHNEAKFDAAWRNGPVYLIMSVNNSGAFQGYARMTSRCGAGGHVAWQGLAPHRQATINNFKVSWEATVPLQYGKVNHLTNPLNPADPRINRQRDGQELPYEVGLELVQMLQMQARAAGAGPQGPGFMPGGGVPGGPMGSMPQAGMMMRGMGGVPGGPGMAAAMMSMAARGGMGGMPGNMGPMGGMPRAWGAPGGMGPPRPGFTPAPPPGRAGMMGPGQQQQQQQQGPTGPLDLPPSLAQRFQGRLGGVGTMGPPPQPPAPPQPPPPRGARKPPMAAPGSSSLMGRGRSPVWGSGDRERSRSRSRSRERAADPRYMTYEEYLAMHAKVKQRMPDIRNNHILSRTGIPAAAAAAVAGAGAANGKVNGALMAGPRVPAPPAGPRKEAAGVNMAGGQQAGPGQGPMGAGGGVSMGMAMNMQQQQQQQQMAGMAQAGGGNVPGVMNNMSMGIMPHEDYVKQTIQMYRTKGMEPPAVPQIVAYYNQLKAQAAMQQRQQQQMVMAARQQQQQQQQQQQGSTAAQAGMAMGPGPMGMMNPGGGMMGMPGGPMPGMMMGPAAMGMMGVGGSGMMGPIGMMGGPFMPGIAGMGVVGPAGGMQGGMGMAGPHKAG